MRVLVLGGSWFVGAAAVEQAATAGHEVTVFNRGRTPATFPEGVQLVRGDRTDQADLDRLASHGPWDAVIDVAGAVPAVVRDSARALSEVAGRYVFVSTVSTYRDWPTKPVNETSPSTPTMPTPPSHQRAPLGRSPTGCSRPGARPRSPGSTRRTDG